MVWKIDIQENQVYTKFYDKHIHIPVKITNCWFILFSFCLYIFLYGRKNPKIFLVTALFGTKTKFIPWNQTIMLNDSFGANSLHTSLNVCSEVTESRKKLNRSEIGQGAGRLHVFERSGF